MKRWTGALCLTTLGLALSAVFISTEVFSQGRKKARAVVVIAHRGASGYLPEHSLQGAAMAHAWGVDYIEPDVVLTKDAEAIVMHDIHLDTTTNVATVFPKRKRQDGRYYAMDFSLAEIKQLRLHERINLKTGKPVFPKRFPLGRSDFQVPTLVEMIELIQGLNKSTGRNVGLYPEIKHAAFHRKAGLDITRTLWKILLKYGYGQPGAKLFVQCFESRPLKRMRFEFKSQAPLIQLIGDNVWAENDEDYNKMLTDPGLRSVAQYADGVGLWLGHLASPSKAKVAPKWRVTNVRAFARKHKLKVHVYTARADALPKGVASFAELMTWLRDQAKVDGVFSDHGDKALALLSRRLH